MKDRRWVAAAGSLLDPRTYIHALHLLHFYHEAHVLQRPRMQLAAGVRIAPNVSIRNGDRIRIGQASHIGERCYLWAGDTAGRITIGANVLLAPEVFITASDYGLSVDLPIMHQQRTERDVVIGDDVWIGARAVIVAGVTIASGCVVAAGAVVTRNVEPFNVVAGVPARVVADRRHRTLGTAS